MRSRLLTPAHPIDLRLTLSSLRHGGADPTLRLCKDEAWRATRTPEGPASLHVRSCAGTIEAAAWGPGAEWALDRLPGLVGLEDDASAFRPRHPALRELHRRMPGLRLARTDGVIEALIPAVLEQKVTSAEAHHAYRQIVRSLGERAPGPVELYLQPSPLDLSRTPYWTLHPFGVERRRARVLAAGCARAGRLEAATSLPADQARARLRAIPGVGAWTAAEVAKVAFGDPDAVSIGDFHLPHLVAWVLAGEPRASDERMLELLEPYRGDRARAVRLIELGGAHPPRFAPRMPVRSIAKM